MNTDQLNAISFLTKDLVSSLVPDVFLSHLIIRNIISSSERKQLSNHADKEAMVQDMLKVLKAKDSGWEVLTNFLTSHSKTQLATTLRNAAGEPTVQLESMKSELERFIPIIRQYYQREFANIPTLWESTRPMKDAWIPITLELLTDGGTATEQFDCSELLNHLKSEPTNLLIVRGIPGGGKTTLIKKIVLDWATLGRSQFELVLVVSGESISPAKSDLLTAVAECLLSKLGLTQRFQLRDLVNQMKELNSALLICLDGAELLRKVLLPKATERDFTHKLLVTSRPLGTVDVLASRQRIVEMEICAVPAKKSLLLEYLRNDSLPSAAVERICDSLISQKMDLLPSIAMLSYASYVADLTSSTSVTVTEVFEGYIKLTLMRADNTVVDGQCGVKWFESNVARSTAKLAYLGYERGRLDLSEHDVQQCGATEILKSGFVTSRFNPLKRRYQYQFVHKSFQEFFAALHCFMLMLGGTVVGQTLLVMGITRTNSLFGQFLFGISSRYAVFPQLLDWLFPVARIDLRFYTFDDFIRMSERLTDCCDGDAFLLGQRLYQYLTALQSEILNPRQAVLWQFCIPSKAPAASLSFTDGLMLISQKMTQYWIVLGDGYKHAKAVRVVGYPKADVTDYVSRADLLVWVWNSEFSSSSFDLTNSFPVPQAFVIRVNDESHFEAQLRLKYSKSARKQPFSFMSHFSFAFHRRLADVLKVTFGGSKNHKFLRLVGQQKFRPNSSGVCLVTAKVKVNKYPTTSELLFSLTHLAMQLCLV